MSERDAFVVSLHGLRRVPGSTQHVVRRGRLGPLQVLSSSIPADAETDVEVTLEAADGGVVASGTVSAPWQGECRRCLAPVSGDLAAEVREVYRAHTDADKDEETYALHGDQLDLRPLARDALLLALPLAPLCRDDCAGLCATCGADLNDGPCDCQAAGTDARWDGLDVLRHP